VDRIELELEAAAYQQLLGGRMNLSSTPDNEHKENGI
jgi:hypothetical protein